jgi:two-component system, OmpR family, alkaline phosphatase synthesis response regulator PhoP
MNRRRILVIDDELPIRAVIQACLEDLAGWQVITAESGHEGVDLAIAQQPDAILLDVSMPELDGEATFQRLRQAPTTCTIPIVFLTARALPEEQEKYLQLGAVGLIIKPFNPMTLTQQIAQQLGWSF